MALTKDDLKQIKGVVDEAITEHPRFGELEASLERKIDESAAGLEHKIAESIAASETKVVSRLERRIDESIAASELKIVTRLEWKIEQSAKRVVEDVSDVAQEGFNMIGERFDHMDKRLDNLRIVSNT